MSDGLMDSASGSVGQWHGHITTCKVCILSEYKERQTESHRKAAAKVPHLPTQLPMTELEAEARLCQDHLGS